MDTPALRYYGSLVGDWSGALRMRVVDGAALRGTDLFTRCMGLMLRIDGRLNMATTLRRGPDDGARPVFEHTTTVTHWGARVLRSEETFTLADDGRSAAMRGVHRVRTRADEPYSGTVVIAADANAATYEFTWMGRAMTQRTERVADGMRLTQQTAWSFAEVLLR